MGVRVLMDSVSKWMSEADNSQNNNVPGFKIKKFFISELWLLVFSFYLATA